MPEPKLSTDEACAPSPHTATGLLGLQQTIRVFWNRSSYMKIILFESDRLFWRFLKKSCREIGLTCRDNLARSMGFRFGPVVVALPVGRHSQILEQSVIEHDRCEDEFLSSFSFGGQS